MDLDKKLAEWAGFTETEYGGVLNGKEQLKWYYPSPQLERLWYLPDFTHSLDACFKWLVPSDYQQIIFQPDGYCGLTVNDTLYEGSGDTSALSFCKAIEKLIDNES